MKDEIKEIVRRMNNLIEHRFDKEYHTECDLFKDIQGLLDYITNLQEENEKLKNKINDVYEFVNWHYKDNQEFYKKKGIGLNYPECDYVLKKLGESND